MLKFLEGKSVDYAAPVIEQVEKFWHEVVLALAEPIEFGVYRKLEAEKIIEKRGTDQYIHCRTAYNPDTLRGGATDLLILDEFQLMHEETWGQAGAPRLIDRNGDAVFIYTPPSMRMRSRTHARDPLHAPKMFKKYKDDPDWLCLHFSSHENPFASKKGIETVTKDLSNLGYRQEILAEDIDQIPGALWTQGDMIDAHRVTSHPELVRIVVAVDPSGGSTNEAGIVTAGLGVDGHGYVLKDSSLLAASPRNWAAAAIQDFYDFSADRIIAEANFGGDMVESTIRGIDENVSYKDVTATRGKTVRAEPISSLYEEKKDESNRVQRQCIVHHVGIFEKLEEEMCSYVPGDKKSPNRMDALVWALTELMLTDSQLGLVEYFKGGDAQKELDNMNKIQSATTLAKPVIADEAPKCPKCEGTMIQTVAGQKRCAACGHQWSENGFGPKIRVITRSEALRGER